MQIPSTYVKFVFTQFNKEHYKKKKSFKKL